MCDGAPGLVVQASEARGTQWPQVTSLPLSRKPHFPLSCAPAAASPEDPARRDVCT